MDVWFFRANGETGHNQPGTKGFIRGEPPNYPERRFNYRQECLDGGFARVGLPAAGDLREHDWRRKACEAYGLDPNSRQLDNLERFANIRIGDVIVMPAAREKYDVHFGVVVPNETSPNARLGSAPYYYHYDVGSGDWFENAHRVPVQWHRASNGTWSVVGVPELGGIWRMSFGRVDHARRTLIETALKAGFTLPSPNHRESVRISLDREDR
jgi:hypothetical protein